MIIRKLRYSFSLHIFLIIMLILPICRALPAHARETAPRPGRTVRVGFPQQTGLTEIDSRGNYSGYTYDYLNILSQFTNWEYEYVTVPGNLDESLTTLLEMLEKGEIDLLGGMVKNEYTQELYDFPDINYGAGYSTLSVLENNTKITETNLSASLSTIGVMASAQKRIAELKKFCSTNLINAEIIEYTDADDTDLYNALYNNEVDAILGVDLDPVMGTRTVAAFSGTPYYFATTKGNTGIMDSLNSSIQLLTEADPYLQSRLYSRYFSQESSVFTLSPDEESYLKNLPALKVLMYSDEAPYQYMGEDGSAHGITITILDSLSGITDLTFEYIARDDSLSLEEQIASQGIDLVAGIPTDPEFAKNHHLVSTLPYAAAELSLFSSWNLDLNNLDHKKLALPEGTEVLEQYESAQTVYYPKLADCMQAVNDGRADFGYADSFSVDYSLTRGIYTNVTTLSILTDSRSLGLGLTAPVSVPLLSILNRYFYKMDENMLHTALTREMIAESRNFKLMDYIRIKPFESICTCLILIGIFMTVVYLWLRSSQKQNILAAQNAAKSIFLSNISHEMRTPLNAIIGMNQIQAGNFADIDTVKDCNAKILTASHHLLQLINDVLDMSQINEGKMKIKQEPFSLNSMIHTIDLVYRPLADQRQISLDFAVGENIPDRILADELHLKQILINLISNAIKYNHNGGSVEVKVSAEENNSPGKLRLTFQVEDDGIGIRPESIRKIFNAFERDEHYGSNKIDGTGLGLSICHELVRLMGSELLVESTVQKGSCFHFTLELEEIEQTSPVPEENKETPASITYDFTGMHILVVEDNETNTLIIKKLLESRHAQVETAENGLIGCHLFEASEPGYFDAILMDIRMPIMDGYKATMHIRSMNRSDASTVCIIAVSANAFLEDLEKSAAAGMDAHLSKPLNPADLYNKLGQLTGTRP